MKKFTKSVLFLLLVSIFLGASLFVGCRNPFMPDAPVVENPTNGGGDGNDNSSSVTPDTIEGGYYPVTGKYSPVAMDTWKTATWKLGATVVESDVEFAVYSKNATRILLEIYEKAYGEDVLYYYWMQKNTDDVWRAKIAGIGDGTLYAFRAWGPNWTFDEDWTRGGSNEGFISDVDSKGNRFNPNKVLFDPYAKEISHDKSHPDVLGNYSGTIYATGEKNLIDGNPSREFDTGKYAPKAVVIDDSTSFGVKPQIPQEKAIIYEAHARGITKHSSSANLSTILNGIEGFENVVDIPAEYQGTYKGAGMLAPYLKALGVNTIELLPVHESDNDANPDNAPGGNYWAYMTYGYFAPDRRYSSDKSLGGPTKEFKEMVAAFHEAGMEVYLDVVFNHSGEGGLWYGGPTIEVNGNDVPNPEFDNYQTVELTFMRGLDNSSWYCLPPAAKGSYWETTGCGNNLQCDNPIVGQMILDSLEYWIDEMGVDGYRFDLAPVVGREFDGTNWNYNPNAQLLKDIASLGASRNAEMIAEAWDIGAYGVGTFPYGWGEWNGRYRDPIRSYVGRGNRTGNGIHDKGDFLQYMNGDYNNFNDQGGPHKSVNFVVAHDGFTLADLCSYEGVGNAQNGILTWPFGPSDGGNRDHNGLSFGTTQADKRRANRNYIAIQMMSRGVPMIVWGDEFCRTQNGNNNPYNIDSVCGWSNYNMINTDSPHSVPTGDGGSYHNNFGTFNNTEDVNGNFMFMKYMLDLKANEPALNRPDYGVYYDFKKNDGITELGDDTCVWVRINGSGVTGTDSKGNTIQGSDYLVFMNMCAEQIPFALPKDNGEIWSLIADTQSYFETNFNYWNENNVMSESSYGVNPWSVVILKNIGKGTTSMPVIEYEADVDSYSMEVTLTSSTAGATIYYTTDGTDPTIASEEYSGPFILNGLETPKTVKAFAVKEDYNDSFIASKSLHIQEYEITNIPQSWIDDSDIVLWTWQEGVGCDKVEVPEISGTTATFKSDKISSHAIVCTVKKGTADDYLGSTSWPNPIKQSPELAFVNNTVAMPDVLYTVYCKPNSSWKTVNLFMFKENGDDDITMSVWPGNIMAKEDDDWYSYSVFDTGTSYDYAIFTKDNGDTKTTDLSFDPSKPYYVMYENSLGGEWVASKEDAVNVTEPIVNNYIIYFKPNASYGDTVHAYVWDSTTANSMVAWPGDKMTVMDDGWYSYEVSDQYDTIQFNKGNDDGKIDNLTLDASKPYFVMYTNSLGGEWVDSKDTIVEDPAPFEPKSGYLYLKPNSNWTQANARFAAYFFGNGDTWVSMTKVINAENLYEVQIPTEKTYPSVIFCRMNPGEIENNWDEGTMWNQSADLTIPTDDKNLYTVAAEAWSKGDGSWSKLE